MKKFKVLSLLMLCLAAMFLLAGCGVKHGSPEGVVKSLVKYSEKGKEKKVLNCYGVEKNADKEIEKEAENMIAYYKAMKSKGIKLVSCDVIEDYETYSLVYISYEVKLKKDKAYPKVETYLVKKDKKKYDVMPAKEITSEMSQEAADAYKTFMTTDVYKEYQKSHEAFLLKNPSFEEELAMKLQ